MPSDVELLRELAQNGRGEGSTLVPVPALDAVLDRLALAEAVVEAARDAVEVWKRPKLGVASQRGLAMAIEADWTDGMVRINFALAALDSAEKPDDH